MKTLIIVALWMAAMGALYYVLTTRAEARLARERMMAREADYTVSRKPDPPGSFLTEWLIRAGFRAPGSATAFVIAMVLSTLLGAGLGLGLALTGVLEPLQEMAAEVSAGAGGIVKTIIALTPWAVFIGLALAPWLYVRGKRRDRIEAIERELPVVLELLATLSESGLGFDASFAKILDSDTENTVLIEEFRIFQLETLGGISRVRCFRRLTRRCEISSMTIFCSALIQAEQIGTGFSTVLRTQADDLRGRRRDRAMIKAQSLPVKLVFPLVICFLPGIFVVTLGPAFMEFFELAAGVVGGAG